MKNKDAYKTVLAELYKFEQLYEKALNDVVTKSKECMEKDKMIDEIKNYVEQEIECYTDTIKDFIDDNANENADFIGSLKEEREHWRDILKIINNKL